MENLEIDAVESEILEVDELGSRPAQSPQRYVSYSSKVLNNI